MRYSLELDVARRCFTVITQGEGNAEGLMASMEAVAHHPQWRVGYSVLVDHRKLCLAELSNSGIENISHGFIELRKAFGDGRCAIVLAKDVDFGLARAWEMITADEVAMAIHIFRDIDKARCWIEAGREQLS